MNTSILSQVARPCRSAFFSKRLTTTVVRTYFGSPVSSFSYGGAKLHQHEKAHHQVAPLTDATIYSPQGVNNMSTTATATATTSPSPEVVFSPTVNHVFDD